LHGPLDRAADGASDTFSVNSGLTVKCVMEGITSDYELKLLIQWQFEQNLILVKQLICYKILQNLFICICKFYKVMVPPAVVVCLYGNGHLGQNVSEANKI
jgi:hypothetical protein